MDEGATSTITNLKNGWVRKTLKRKTKRTNILPITTQIEIQNWSSKLLEPANGFHILFTPRVRKTNGAATNQYEMEKIDTSRPIEKVDNDELEKELIAYFQKAKKKGYYPSDFELYEQPVSGKIALLDFDKYGLVIEGKQIRFPFRGTHILSSYSPKEAFLTESTSKKLQKALQGGKSRSRSKSKKIKYSE